MYPLIEIKTVPVEIQIKTKNASLEYKRGTAEMEISRSDNGGLEIKSRPIKLQADSFEARNSLSPTPASAVSQNADAGQAAAYDATATYARHGQLMVNAKLGQNVTAQIAQETSEKNVHTESGLDFIPETGVNVDWENGEFLISYDMEKMTIDFKVENGQFTFTPGDIEITANRPEMTINYIGGPIYVPPSSDPNYKAVDVKA